MIAAAGIATGVLVAFWIIRKIQIHSTTPVWDHRPLGTDTFTQNGRVKR